MHYQLLQLRINIESVECPQYTAIYDGNSY